MYTIPYYIMEILKEGKIKFYSYLGKPTKDLPVFYNPDMEKQRDITVCALSVLQKDLKKKISVCDPLAGSGVRGLRILKEIKGIERIVFNDVSEESVKLIKKNLSLNKLKGKVFNKDARILLLENRSAFDFVDIDPFGSPIRYLESAVYSLKHKGFFAATATDTGALAGSFSKTCFRRYGIKVCRTDFYKEFGVRVLITAVQQAFARNNSAFIPLLCHSAHYFRVIGYVEKNRGAADRAVKNIGFVSYCKKCLWRSLDIERVCGNCKEETNILGPLWLGQIQNNEFAKKVVEEAERRKFKIKFSEEADAPFYYDLASVCRAHKMQSVKIEKVIEFLKNSGFKASRSGLCPTGIKTDAGILELVKANS